MNYYDKYLKYKNKYLENKKSTDTLNIINKSKFNKFNKLNKLNNQKAGTYVLYASSYTRIDMNLLSLKEKKYIIDESLSLNRYFHKYMDINGKLKTEGIDLAYGPGGEEERFFINDYIENVEVDVDWYESYLIYNYLVKINNNLKKFGIKTVQSQISYYSKDISYQDKDYFQNPFLTFSGIIESIPILKKMMEHPFAKDLLFFSHYDTRPDESLKDITNKTYITFAKPVFNDRGKFIYTFNDTDFWTKMEKISSDINIEYSLENISMFEGNDPELDLSKDWYVLDDDSDVVKIEDKTKPNPYSLNGLPLTTLNVRYIEDIEEFTKVYSKPIS